MTNPRMTCAAGEGLKVFVPPIPWRHIGEIEAIQAKLEDACRRTSRTNITIDRVLAAALLEICQQAGYTEEEKET